MKYEDAIKLMPDERLKELIDISEGRKELEEMPIDIEKYQMAQELLLLRQQVEEWREDACRLVHYAECYLNCDSQHDGVCDCGCDDVCESHDALLEKYPG